MDNFQYVDLFATKGIEYLLVIGFLLTLVLFWRFLNRPAGSAAGVQPASSSPWARREWFLVPEGLFYHRGHTWARPEEENLVSVGMDDFAQQLVGAPDAVELPGIGSEIRQGDNAWQLSFGTETIGMLSPVNGTVESVNDEVLRNPSLLTEDSYGAGWLMKVRVPRLKSDFKNLLSGKLVTAWMDDATHSLRTMMGGQLGAVYQDGGVPVKGMAKALAPDTWDLVAKNFFMTD